MDAKAGWKQQAFTTCCTPSLSDDLSRASTLSLSAASRMHLSLRGFKLQICSTMSIYMDPQVATYLISLQRLFTVCNMTEGEHAASDAGASIRSAGQRPRHRPRPLPSGAPLPPNSAQPGRGVCSGRTRPVDRTAGVRRQGRVRDEFPSYDDAFGRHLSARPVARPAASRWTRPGRPRLVSHRVEAPSHERRQRRQSRQSGRQHFQLSLEPCAARCALPRAGRAHAHAAEDIFGLSAPRRPKRRCCRSVEMRPVLSLTKVAAPQ